MEEVIDLFSYIRSILFTKKNLIDDFDEDEYVPFFINRWMSMYSPELCYFINNTINFRLDKIFSDKKDIYKFAYNIMPKQKYERISYIKKSNTQNKKTKKDEEYEQKIIDYSINYELSQKEIRNLLELKKELNVDGK